MAKNKRELQAELEAANKRIAELSQSNQNANSTVILNRRLVTKIMSGICDKETRTKLLAISPLPDLQTVTDLCRSE